MTGPALRLVVFDVDGTLLDSLAGVAAALAVAFRASGRPPPPPVRATRIVGLALEEGIARLDPTADAGAVAAIAAAYRAEMIRARAVGGAEAAAPLFPGARAALDRLAGEPETLLGLATGKARRGLTHALTHHELAPYFVTTQCGSEHPGKPNPAMLEAALRETGVSADRAVMVGDTTFDVAMARSAGFAAVGVSFGAHGVDELQAAGAASVIDSFDQLDAALETIAPR